jgi:hypothetical protein
MLSQFELFQGTFILFCTLQRSSTKPELFQDNINHWYLQTPNFVPTKLNCLTSVLLDPRPLDKLFQVLLFVLHLLNPSLPRDLPIFPRFSLALYSIRICSYKFLFIESIAKTIAFFFFDCFNI